MFYGEIIFIIAQKFLQENHSQNSKQPYEKIEKILVQRNCPRMRRDVDNFLRITDIFLYSRNSEKEKATNCQKIIDNRRERI